MQLIYKPLFSVAFRHNYYLDNCCRSMKAVPADNTKFLMDKYGLAVKLNESGFRVYYESWFAGRERTYEEIKQLPLILEIVLINTDIYFYNYTNGFIDHTVSDTVLCFRNNNENSQEDGRLHSDIFAQRNAAQSNNAAPTWKEASPGNFRKSFGVIYFNLQQLQPVDYYIQFNAKNVQWRYIVATPYLMDLESPAIINKTDQSAFTGPVSCILPDLRKALLFTSNSTLTLSEQPNRNLQLVENYNAASGRHKVIIHMLPNPNIKLISVINSDAERSALVPYADVII